MMNYENDDDDGAPAPEPKQVIQETAKGSDKVYKKSEFRITSLDLGQKWRATGIGSGLWAAARACKEVGSTSDENFSEQEDALMVMLLAGANPCHRNARGQLPIHFAESASATRILVNLGGMATINAVDTRGRTPLHYAARYGHDLRCKELIRLGADTLLRDSQKNTPADTAKKARHQNVYEILKWAAKRQANGAVIPPGGLLGESATDRKAKLFKDDAEYARWKRAKPCLPQPGTFDRAKNLPVHMQKGIWSGPLPKGVNDTRQVEKRLQRHITTWSTELVQLWVSTDPALGGFNNNSNDINRRIGRCKVTGRHLAYLHPLVTQSNDPIMQFLGMICVAPTEKKLIVSALGTIIERQMGMAPAPFLETIEATAKVADMLEKAKTGDEMLQREAQRLYDYNTVEMPVALGDRSSFVIIGSIAITPLTSIWAVWERLLSSDPRTAKHILKAAKAVENDGRAAAHEEQQGGWFWLCTPKDNRRMCRVSIDNCGNIAAPAPSALVEKPDEKVPDKHSSGQKSWLSKRQQDDEEQFLSLSTPCYAHAYPLLLIAPVVAEELIGVEWTGTRMLRQWIEPSEVAEKDNAWKTAHRFKIEGFEAKKRWAEEERLEEIRLADKLGRKKQ